MTIEDIIAYVVRSPENVNANMLRGMLEQFAAEQETNSEEIEETPETGE